MRWLICLILACLLGYSTQAWAGCNGRGNFNFGNGRRFASARLFGGVGYNQQVLFDRFGNPVTVNGFGAVPFYGVPTRGFGIHFGW